MLLKEYRIVLPLTVEEYKIAQLYMIVKKSRQMTKSAGSAVEIIKNEPYTDGPGGCGQCTHKLLHIEEHLPGWLKTILPKSAMVIEEQAWNAYPYTKTKYLCSFIERFVLEIETVYLADDGSSYNVFDLSPKLLSQRIVDFVDIVNDPVNHDYKSEEDPSKFVSKKTKRGPLTSEWKKHLSKSNCMCAYKLCRVEFRYWGLQTKIEQFIHDVALRKTILSGHRAAWCWQDEWIDLTLDDIRKMEEALQTELQQKVSHFILSGRVDTVDNMTDYMESRSSATQPLNILSDDSTDEYYDAVSTFTSPDNNTINRHGNQNNYSHSAQRDVIDYLILLFHTGCLDFSETKSDFSTFELTLRKIVDSHFRYLSGHVAMRLVSCEPFCQDLIKHLSRLSTAKTVNNRMLDSLALFIVSHPNYRGYVNSAIKEANAVFDKFCAEFGRSFDGEVILVGDAIGAIFAYDSLISYEPDCAQAEINQSCVLKFNVSSFFCFGSPLGLILLQRFMKQNYLEKPSCEQVYNLFHGDDPYAFRIEPLLSPRFRARPPVIIPRFRQSLTMSNDLAYMFGNGITMAEASPHLSEDSFNAEGQWWGTRRIDYTLYAPESLVHLPAPIFSVVVHSSYWESYDVITFMLQMLLPFTNSFECSSDQSSSDFHSVHSLKKNSSPNHRTNDVIALENGEQIIRAKFFCGPLDVLFNSNKVDVFYQPLPTTSQKNSVNDWQLLGTKESDSLGKFVFKLPEKLLCGVYAIKMVVRADNSSVFSTLFVVPPYTATVIFSIDGSLRASFSVRGRDPKVQAGAVDVVRYWQRLGYLILYVSARPELQLSHVFRWLALHNFPRGPVILSDCITTVPLRHKLEQLKALCLSAKLSIKAGYGSIKDISVYNACGISNEKIFVVGKAKSKQSNKAQFISDGYAAHLTYLTNRAESNVGYTNEKSALLNPTSDKFNWFPKNIEMDFNMF